MRKVAAWIVIAVACAIPVGVFAWAAWTQPVEGAIIAGIVLGTAALVWALVEVLDDVG